MGQLGVVSIQHHRAEVFLEEVNGRGGRILNLSQRSCVNDPGYEVHITCTYIIFAGVFGFPHCPGNSSVICEEVRRLLEIGAYNRYCYNINWSNLVQSDPLFILLGQALLISDH